MGTSRTGLANEEAKPRVISKNFFQIPNGTYCWRLAEKDLRMDMTPRCTPRYVITYPMSLKCPSKFQVS
jgi:hypothetical protein